MPATELGTYELIAGNVDFANIWSVGFANADDLGGDKIAYFEPSSLWLTIVPESRTLMVDYDRCTPLPGMIRANPCKRGRGSYHPGGLHFVLCDGSVRFISTTVDVWGLAGLASIAGGEVLELP